jgi:hypothetical protein
MLVTFQSQTTYLTYRLATASDQGLLIIDTRNGREVYTDDEFPIDETVSLLIFDTFHFMNETKERECLFLGTNMGELLMYPIGETEYGPRFRKAMVYKSTKKANKLLFLRSLEFQDEVKHFILVFEKEVLILSFERDGTYEVTAEKALDTICVNANVIGYAGVFWCVLVMRSKAVMILQLPTMRVEMNESLEFVEDENVVWYESLNVSQDGIISFLRTKEEISWFTIFGKKTDVVKRKSDQKQNGNMIK